jgi:CubicO group peptidase (beta-lactamase class C family)
MSVVLACGLLVALGGVTLGVGAEPVAAACPSGQVASGTRVCLARGDPRAASVLSTVRAVQHQYAQKAVLFGVWQHGRVVATGALGTSYPLVPATPAMHFRIGNVTESMTCTLLLQLVERGKLSLNDRVSKWLPWVPHGNEVTVGQVAQGTAGYASFYTDQWTAEFQADPFRFWPINQIISIGASQPLDFVPGSTWKFSDTNFAILGQILAKAGGAPIATLIQRDILRPLHLTNTQMTSTSAIPPPVLHGYDPERGDYQDSTFWSVSWATGFGDMTSNLSDMGRWAAALGTGKVLTPAGHARQFAPVTVGLPGGPFKSTTTYAALGAVVVHGWIICNPNVPGYWDTLAYLPTKRLAIVISSTPTAGSPQNVHYAVAAFDRIASLLAPSSAPNFPTS